MSDCYVTESRPINHLQSLSKKQATVAERLVQSTFWSAGTIPQETTSMLPLWVLICKWPAHCWMLQDFIILLTPLWAIIGFNDIRSVCVSAVNPMFVRLHSSCSSHIDREIMPNIFVQVLAFILLEIGRIMLQCFHSKIAISQTVRKGSIHIKFMTKKKYSVMDKTTVNNRSAERKSIWIHGRPFWTSFNQNWLQIQAWFLCHLYLN